MADAAPMNREIGSYVTSDTQWEVRRLYRSLPINVGYVD